MIAGAKRPDYKYTTPTPQGQETAVRLRAARRLDTLCLFQNAEGGSHEGQGQQQRQQRADDGENHQQRQGDHEQQCGDKFRQACSLNL